MNYMTTSQWWALANITFAFVIAATSPLWLSVPVLGLSGLIFFTEVNR